MDYRRKREETNLVVLEGKYENFRIRYSLYEFNDHELREIDFTVYNIRYKYVVSTSYDTRSDSVEVSQSIQAFTRKESKKRTIRPTSDFADIISMSDFLAMEQKLYEEPKAILDKLVDLASWCDFVSKLLLEPK